MSDVLYEHPLNQCIRNYLKLEQLFVQAADCIQMPLNISYNTFFNALFAITDTLERNDIRGDLIKDLERLEQNLVMWSRAPDVDTSAIEQNLRETVTLISQLKQATPSCYQLKDDKFLEGVKKRFAMQGGSSSFDLPQLQFWLNRPEQEQITEATNWLSLLAQVENALALILKFIRMRADFEQINTESGFYQGSGEGLSLLRMKIPQTANYYPTVSGNRFRYSIRFMLPCEKKWRRFSDQPTAFKLARC